MPEAPVGARAPEPVPAEPSRAPRRARAASARAALRHDAIAFAVLAAVFALPLRGLLRAPGPPMEEGFMLVFPERVLRGDIPNRDFLHLYGPGSLWALAGAFKVFGVSLLTERLFGLAQQIAIVVSVYAIARRFDRVLAATGAAIAALVLIPFGLTALAWVGAVGLGLGGVAAGLEAHARQGSAHAGRWCVASGLLFGLALTFRLDLVIAVGLSAVVLARGLPREQRIRLFAGLGVAIAPYAVHLATAGPGNVWRGMVLDPVFHLRGGRSLPIPPSWSRLDGFLQRAGALQQLTWPIPAPRTSQQLFLWFFLLLFAIALLVVLAVRALRTEPGSLQSIALLAVACFSAGILPQALQRVDSAHFAWVGCVPFGFLPIAIFRVARGWFPRVPVRRLTLAASAAALAVVVVVIPAFTITRYTDYSLQTFGRHRHSYEITHGGRTFYYGKPDRAEAARQVIAAAAQIARPGQRLFVGPVNLRKTPYSDAYLYYMLPSLRPATYYIEMDPGVANAEDSGLDADLAASDIVILSAIWDDWDEPNDSRLTGSGKAERVLARDFCLVGEYLRLYRLYRRCA